MNDIIKKNEKTFCNLKTTIKAKEEDNYIVEKKINNDT